MLEFFKLYTKLLFACWFKRWSSITKSCIMREEDVILKWEQLLNCLNCFIELNIERNFRLKINFHKIYQTNLIWHLSICCFQIINQLIRDNCVRLEKLNYLICLIWRKKNFKWNQLSFWFWFVTMKKKKFRSNLFVLHVKSIRFFRFFFARVFSCFFRKLVRFILELSPFFPLKLAFQTWFSFAIQNQQIKSIDNYQVFKMK